MEARRSTGRELRVLKRMTGGVLLALAGFMLLGFLRADLDTTPVVAALTLIVAVGIPAAAGGVMLAGGRNGRRSRIAELRRQTVEAEVLRLASAGSGRLAVVEIVRDLGVSSAEAEEALQALMRRGVADVEVTPSGGIVYAFPDIRLLDEKSRARGILDED